MYILGLSRHWKVCEQTCFCFKVWLMLSLFMFKGTSWP